MKKTWMLSLCAVSVASAAVAFAVQGDTGGRESKPQEEQGAEMMMGAKPSEHHKMLAQMAGTWDAKMDMGEMGSHSGVETSKVALNGLWLVGDFEMADFMGMPFQGHSVLGYDSQKKKYVGMWIDSTTDRITLSEGEFDRAKKQLVMHAENVDHETGEMRKERHVTEFTSPDAYVFKMIPEGSEEPSMTIEYTRKKQR